MRFEEIYSDWHDKRLTQAEAARLLDVCERTFRRQPDGYMAANRLRATLFTSLQPY